MPKNVLLQIPALGIAGRVRGQQTEHKQQHKKGNSGVNAIFKGQHTKKTRAERLSS
jgi:hypothetical protein